MPRAAKKEVVAEFSRLLEANKEWAASQLADDPDYFNRLAEQQSPEYFWVGCSDSRVPANQILNLAPGEVFVQRNVGNQALHTDLNYMSCLEYAVKSLKVKTIIVCGHYMCGAVKAALQLPVHTPGLVNCWISDIRECRNQHEAELQAEPSPERQLERLCELNVLRQVFHVCTSPVVASAWAEGQELHVWGVIYHVGDGVIRRLAGPFSADSDHAHTLEHFTMDVAGGGASSLRVQRCPSSGALRVLTEDGEALPAADALSPGASSDGAAGGLGSDGGAVDGQTSAQRSTVSEVRAAVNNISLMDRISRHTKWSDGGPKAPAAPAPAPAPA